MAIGNSEGVGGGLKVKNFKGKYEAKLKFLNGWEGVQTQKPSVGEVWIFFGTTQCQ